MSLSALLFVSSGAFAQDVLFDLGADWSYFKGTAEPSDPDLTAWRTAGFDDSTWEMGPSGFGYGDGDDATVLGDMQGFYSTLYLRRSFSITDVGSITSLVLGVNYDDGFVCYVNGVEALRVNAGNPGEDLPFDALANPGHEANGVEFFELDFASLGLANGDNLIAVQVLNTTLDSTDLSFNARLAANDPSITCPTGITCESLNTSILLSWTVPAGAAYDSVSVTKDGVPLPGSPFPGDTLFAEDTDPGDYLHDYEVIATVGAFDCSALTCSTTPEIVLMSANEDWLLFRGTVAPSDPATAWREVGFDDSLWEVVTTGVGYGDGDDNTTLDDMEDGYVSIFLRKEVSITEVALLRSLVLEVDYDDGLIAFLNGTEIARSASMGTAGQEFAFDQVATAGHEAGTPEQFPIDLGLVQEGTNLLAVQVHNVNLGSSDLSFIPRLIRNACPTITGLSCDYDELTGEVTVTWAQDPAFDSIEVTRDGVPVPGSPFAGDTDTYVDTDPGDRDATYEVTPSLGVLPCASATCDVTCEDRDPSSQLLTCTLSLVDGATQATVSWATPPDATGIEVIREGDSMAMLDPSETSFVDPNVESLEPEDDTDFEVVFSFDDGSTCTITCNESLCVENLICTLVDDTVELSWENVVKEWETYTITRDDGVNPAEIIVSDLPGDSAFYVDTTAPLAPLSSYTYTLTPVAPLGEEVGGCGDLTCTVSVPLPELGAYDPPAGGWDYVADFSTLATPQYNPVAGEPGNIDGSWIRSLDVDSWDGSEPLVTGPAPDGEAPGGIGVEQVDGGGPCSETISVLRLLDPGDPTDPVGSSLEADFPEPYNEPNNRRIALALDTGVFDRNLLRDGVTIAARWRVNPVSPAYLNASATGDGSPIQNGLGQIGIIFQDDGSLGTAGLPAALTLSLQSGDILQVSTEPVTAIDGVDIDTFSSLWITIEDSEGDDFYNITSYANGDTAPLALGVAVDVPLQTATADFGSLVGNFLTIGVPHDTNDADIQIDYVAYKEGVHAPNATPCEPSDNNRPTAVIAVSPSDNVQLSGASVEIMLDGTASDDGDGGTQGLTYLWSKDAGPGGASIADATAPASTVTLTQAGSYTFRLRVNDGESANNTHSATIAITVRPEGGGPLFIRGDVDGNGGIAINDGIGVFNFLFTGLGTPPTCVNALDADDDGGISLTDGVRVLNVLFRGMGVIPAPFPDCGEDPTPSGEECVSHAFCD